MFIHRSFYIYIFFFLLLVQREKEKLFNIYIKMSWFMKRFVLFRIYLFINPKKYKSLHGPTPFNIYIYIYIYVCVCVCVCVIIFACKYTYV